MLTETEDGNQGVMRKKQTGGGSVVEEKKEGLDGIQSDSAQTRTNT